MIFFYESQIYRFDRDVLTYQINVCYERIFKKKKKKKKKKLTYPILTNRSAAFCTLLSLLDKTSKSKYSSTVGNTLFKYLKYKNDSESFSDYLGFTMYFRGFCNKVDKCFTS